LVEGGDEKAAVGVLTDALHQIQHRLSQMDPARRETYLTGRPENRRAQELARTWSVPVVSP
jgi:hypothetical protein